MNILALSGWGQPHDALAAVFPQAAHVDYARHDSVDAALEEIARAGREAELAVGWSLGGQLLARAVAAGLLAPKKLVLIAAPFQFVEMNGSGLGMKRDTFDQFLSNYVQNPLRTLSKAWELVPFDDARAPAIRETMGLFSKQAVLAADWLKWLKLIEGYSCESLDFSAFPPTLLVHGEEDVVVGVNQSRAFAGRLPRARLEVWSGCGHAPHWHDSKRLQALIAEHARV